MMVFAPHSFQDAIIIIPYKLDNTKGAGGQVDGIPSRCLMAFHRVFTDVESFEPSPLESWFAHGVGIPSLLMHLLVLWGVTHHNELVP